MSGWNKIEDGPPNHTNEVLVSVSMYNVDDERFASFVGIDKYLYWRDGGWYNYVIKKQNEMFYNKIDAWQEKPEVFK